MALYYSGLCSYYQLTMQVFLLVPRAPLACLKGRSCGLGFGVFRQRPCICRMEQQGTEVGLAGGEGPCALVLPGLAQACLMTFCYIETYGGVNWILKSFRVIKGKESWGKGLSVRA